MATAADISDDLDELCSVNDELTDRFMKAANHLQSLVSSLDDQILLKLYGYYKQGIEGRCNVPKPSWYDIRGKSKWEAWKKLGNMPQIDAKTMYIKEIEKLDPNFKTEEASVQVKESWVTVSTLQRQDVQINDEDKTIADFVKEGNEGKVLVLLKSKSYNVNELDSDGMALIHWAADRGSIAIIKALIDNEADINLPDADAQTALHYASSCGHQECVRFLLEHGSNRNAVDNDGSNPMDVASDNHIKEMLANECLPLSK